MIEIDASIFRYLNTTFHFEPLNTFFIILTSQKYAFIPIIILLFFLVKAYKVKGWWIFLGVVASAGLADFISSGIMKKIFMRPRPCQTLEGIFFWYKKVDPPWLVTDFSIKESYKSSFSFPSSHAANSMAVAIFTSFYLKKFSIFLIVFSLLIGYSRIHVGVHYLSDISVGFIVGAICAFFVKYLFEMVYGYFEKRRVEKV
jgi:undecaprenyl-diphosphatase